MLNEIFAIDKRLAIANQRLRSTFPEYTSVHDFIDGYLQCYVDYYGLNITSIIEHYNNFARSYAKHLEVFQETGLYPYEYSDTVVVDKRSYDVALILSCVTNTARFEIVQHLAQAIGNPGAEKICVIGAGAGIELALIKQFARHARVTAYDLAVDDFVKQQFDQFTLKQENFLSADTTETFDIIFAVELLEHITHYENIMHKAWQILAKGGSFICTTATNMPQFDHVYNFRDMELFKAEVFKSGFSIAEHRQFRQQQQ